MKRTWSLISLIALAAAAHAEPRSVVEARVIAYHGKVVGRSVVGYGVRADGKRWFYSRTVITAKAGSLEGTTTLVSLSEKDGTPISALYDADLAKSHRTTTVEVHGDQVTMIEETKGRGAGHREATVKIEPGTTLQISEFNPYTVPGVFSNADVPLTLVEPVALGSAKASLRKTATVRRFVEGQETGRFFRFELRSGESSVSRIEVDDEGRFSYMENDLGFAVKVAKPDEDDLREVAEAEAKLAKA